MASNLRIALHVLCIVFQKLQHPTRIFLQNFQISSVHATTMLLSNITSHTTSPPVVLLPSALPDVFLQTASKWQKQNSTTCFNLESSVLLLAAGLHHFTWYQSRHLVTGILVVTTALSIASQFLIAIQFLTSKIFLHLFMAKQSSPKLISSKPTIRFLSIQMIFQKPPFQLHLVCLNSPVCLLVCETLLKHSNDSSTKSSEALISCMLTSMTS